MRKTLRSKIFFYLLIVALAGILLTSLSVLWGFEDTFNEYLKEDREKSIEVIKNEAIQEYKETSSLVSEQIEQLLHQQAMSENLFYRIYDIEGKVVLDSTGMLGMMGMGMRSGTKEDYVESSYTLTLNKQEIGTLEVFYPKGLMGEDFTFLQTIKQNIYIAGIVTILLSFLFSLLISKRLASGVKRLSKAIQELQNHQRVHVPVDELTEEMKPLGHSFNQLVESLSKEEMLRKQFTGDLAHELRTPLATLRSQIEAYQDGVWEPTPIRLQQSHDELMRLVRLVNELEKLLAAENPQIKLQKTKIEASKLTEHLEVQFTPMFSEKGVQLLVKKPEQEHWFLGDRDRVVQILTNIITNALKYSMSGKRVWVDIEENEQYVGFIVKDEGSGISEEDLPYIFERFYRGDKSRDRKTGGIGIGLSIVKALVDSHNGKIKIDSKLNVGTTVKVFFSKK